MLTNLKSIRVMALFAIVGTITLLMPLNSEAMDHDGSSSSNSWGTLWLSLSSPLNQ